MLKVFSPATIIFLLCLIQYGTELCNAQSSSSEEDNDCKCVPYANCRNLTDGAGLIGLRSPGECDSFLQKCCDPDDIIRVLPDREAENVRIPAPQPPRTHAICGKRNPKGIGFEIVPTNRSESQYAEFPWMAAVLIKNSTGFPVFLYQGGGSLIHPSVVITAAHKVYDRSVTDLKVRLGEWDTKSDNEPHTHQDRRVKKIVVHPEFNPDTGAFGIALLFLDEPVIFADNVDTICLPPLEHSFTGNQCFVTGWGKFDFHATTKANMIILKKISLPFIDHRPCQRMFRNNIKKLRSFRLHDSFVCAGGEADHDACSNDGGAPLVCPIPNTENRFYQAGVVVWGIECGTEGLPGVYVSITKTLPWIGEVLEQNDITDYSCLQYSPEQISH